MLATFVLDDGNWDYPLAGDLLGAKFPNLADSRKISEYFCSSGYR
jgi:hypothetical protein